MGGGKGVVRGAGGRALIGRVLGGGGGMLPVLTPASPVTGRAADGGAEVGGGEDDFVSGRGS
jgi:hypothetical protein